MLSRPYTITLLDRIYTLNSQSVSEYQLEVILTAAEVISVCGMQSSRVAGMEHYCDVTIVLRVAKGAYKFKSISLDDTLIEIEAERLTVMKKSPDC